MLAVNVRTVIVANDDLALLHAALAQLAAGLPLTALESGVVAEESIKDLELIEPLPAIIFDGERYAQFLYISKS